MLLPFSLLYGLIAAIRNLCYDKGIFKSYKIPFKSICVGNLSIGGTGKSPHVDFLIDHFLKNGKTVATLSRGYGRTTKGLLEVNTNNKGEDVGDEPLMYKLKHRDQLKVIVSEKRIEGVNYIENSESKTDLLILDDAFQHRAVKADLNILLTDYTSPYYNDFVLPAGNLREWRNGKKRADIMVVSKCPDNISVEKKNEIRSKLQFREDRIFFSHIQYGNFIPFNVNESPLPDSVESILLITGIANPKPLENYLRNKFEQVELEQFPDHHLFSEDDVRRIIEKYNSMNSKNSIILTTEKDFVRLRSNPAVSADFPWYYIPITIKIDRQDDFLEILR